MVDLLGYGEKDSTQQSIVTLVVIGLLSLFLFVWLDLGSLLEATSPSFESSSFPLVLVLIWRLSCFLVCLRAVVFMWQMNTGTMHVIDHENRQERLIHPLKWEKFVTFSSWTLLVTLLYFLSSIIASFSSLFELSIPSLLATLQVALFSTAIGAAFLTSTVVRLVILPGEVRIRRNHDHQFFFHNQIMHNFAAVFLTVEILIVQPDLHAAFSLFGLMFGVLYALFAYPYAFYWKGYYVYGFIDPRLRFAPLLQTGLASAVSLFYIGLWLGSEVVSRNWVLGSILLLFWVSRIVQFKSSLPRELEL